MPAAGLTALAPAVAAVTVLAGPAGHDTSHAAIRETAWVAAALWGGAALGVVAAWRPGRGVSRPYGKLLRWVTAAGCAVYLLHVAVAFHAGHGWSHAAAVDHVERRSRFGPGLFVSYLFTAVWVLDTLWCAVDYDGYRVRPRWLSRGTHLFMAFVVFNATVVFGQGFGRWVFACLFAAVVVVYVRGREGRIRSDTSAAHGRTASGRQAE